MAIRYAVAQRDGTAAPFCVVHDVKVIALHPVLAHTANISFMAGNTDMEKDEVLLADGSIVAATGMDIPRLREYLGLA